MGKILNAHLLKSMVCTLSFVVTLLLYVDIYASPDSKYEKGILYSSIAFQNSGDSGQYEKSLELIDEAITELSAELKNTPSAAGDEKLSRWKNTRESVDRFYRLSLTRVRNRYPLLHHFKSSAAYFDKYKRNELISIINILKELNENAEILRMERPLFLTVISDSSVEEGVREEAFHLIEEAGVFHVTGQDYLAIPGGRSIHGLIKDTFRDLSESGDFNSLLVFHISEAGEVEGFKMVKGTIYKTDGTTVHKLASSDSFGYNTSNVGKKSCRLVITVAVLSLIFISLFVTLLFKLERYTPLEELMKILLALILFFIGIAAVWFLSGYYYNIFIPQDEVGSGYYLLIAGAAGVFLLLILAAALLIVKFEGTVAVTQNSFYLPLLYGALLLGASVPMMRDQFLYSYIYYPERVRETVYLPLLFFLSGINTGLTVRGVYKALLINRGGYENNSYAVNRIISGVFVLFLILQIFIPAVAFEHHLTGNSSFYKIYLLCAAAVFFIAVIAGLFIKETGVKGEVVKSRNVKIPVTVDELRSCIKNPVLLNRMNFRKAVVSRIDTALDPGKGIEGGVVYIYGESGSGITRYSEEIADIYSSRGTTVINIKCAPPSDETDDHAYRCFIDGLSGVSSSSRVNAIKVSRSMRRVVDRGTKSISNPLSMIPVAGGALSWLFSSDTSGLTDSSDYRSISKKLSTEMLNISKRLVRRNRANTVSAGLLFIVDDFQHIDDRSIELISEFIMLLNTSVHSKEKNPVAFILCGSETSEGSGARGKYNYLRGLLKDFNNDKLSARFSEYRIEGIRRNPALVDGNEGVEDVREHFETVRDFLMYNLNFTPDATDVILNILDVKFPRADSYLPGDLLRIIERLIDENHLKEGTAGFHFRDGSVEEKTVELLEDDIIARYNSMSLPEKLIVSNAAVTGPEFDINELKACVTGIPECEMVNYLYGIERGSGIITETGPGVYRFSDELVRKVFLNTILKNPADSGYNSIFYSASGALFDYYESGCSGRCNKHNHALHAIYSRAAGLEKKIKTVLESVMDYINERDFVSGAEQLDLFLAVNSELIKSSPGSIEMMVQQRLLNILSELVLNRREAVDTASVKDILHVIFDSRGKFIESHAADFVFLAFYLRHESYFKNNWTLSFCEEMCTRLKGAEIINSRCAGHFWHANVFKVNGNSKKAEDEINMAGELFNALDERDELKTEDFEARLCNTKGDILNMNGKTDDAIDCFRRSIELKSALEDYTGLAMSYSTLSGIYHKQGNKSDALKASEQSDKCNRAVKNSNGISITSFNLAELYRDVNSPLAFRYAAESFKYSKARNRGKSLMLIMELMDKSGKDDIPVELREFFSALNIKGISAN